MANPSEIEMSLMCRLCLAKDRKQVTIPIFEDHGDIRQIFLKISSCLPIKITKEDQLPKNICDGCSDKLDLLYEFWNTSLNSEKTLLFWLAQAGLKDDDDPTIGAHQQIVKPVETLVKEEIGVAPNLDLPQDEASEPEEEPEAEEPPKKRARRTAAVKAQIQITPESEDDDDDEDNVMMDEPESVDADAIAKLEEDSEESDGEEKVPPYADVPGTSAQDQPGTSGLGKDGAEAPDKLQCSKCPLIFKMHKALIEHEQTCTGRGDSNTLIQKFNDSYKCTHCEKVFHKKSKIKRHINVVHFRQEMSECNECNKVFISNNTLIRHMKMHTGLKLSTFSCDICGKAYTYKGGVQKHKLLVHVQEFDIVCHVCQKGFFSKSDLKRHVQGVHEKSDALIPCPAENCNKLFKLKPSLKYHLETAHNDNQDKPELVCCQCGKIFNHPRTLKSHLAKHKRCKTYPCTVCEKVLTSLTGLKHHLRTHTGEKPFVCERCGQRFNVADTLKAHMVTHTRERPFPCNMCDKKFTQKSPLVLHIRRFHNT